LLRQTGLAVLGPAFASPTPASAAEIAAAYDGMSWSVIDTVQTSWSDKDLQRVDLLWGELEWPRSETLLFLMLHEVHHRGQLTVLMRLAGLKVPGVLGGSYEDWQAAGIGFDGLGRKGA
jgi:uncharacterized damage-inducible protein DinB